MKKILKILVFAIIINCCVNLNAFAALPNSLGKLTKPESYDEAYKIIDSFGSTFKMSAAEGAVGAVFCTKHQDKSPSGEDTVCTMNDDWSVAVRAGVAAIIQKASVNNFAVSEKYIYAVYTINQFLYNKQNEGSASSVYPVPGQNVSLEHPSLATNQYYIDYLNAANEAFNNAVDPTLEISANKLVFTLKNNEYVSNEITITSDSKIEVSTDSYAKINDIGNSKYTVSVQKDQIKIGEPLTVSLNVISKKSVSQARNYSCGTYVDVNDRDEDGDTTESLNYQTVTPSTYDTLTLSKTAKITGTIEINTSLTIKKQGEDKKLLPGVVLKVESKENDYEETFTTTNKEIKIENLKLGKYIITEISTPEGYVKLKEPKEVVISDENLNEVVTLTNSLTRVEISKISSNDKKMLSGAVLQLQDKDGNVLKNEYDKNYEWATTDEPHVIIGLAPGTYYLAEIISPEGYELNKERIEFEVDGETKIIEVKMENNIEVKVPDTLSTRSALLITISMFDIFLGIGIMTYVKKNKNQE